MSFWIGVSIIAGHVSSPAIRSWMAGANDHADPNCGHPADTDSADTIVSPATVRSACRNVVSIGVPATCSAAITSPGINGTESRGPYAIQPNGEYHAASPAVKATAMPTIAKPGSQPMTCDG